MSLWPMFAGVALVLLVLVIRATGKRRTFHFLVGLAFLPMFATFVFFFGTTRLGAIFVENCRRRWQRTGGKQ
jgi:hypothetical protein